MRLHLFTSMLLLIRKNFALESRSIHCRINTGMFIFFDLVSVQ